MRPILWIAVVALLLAAVGSQLRVTTCTGECCAVEAAACCQLTTDDATGHECRGCCDDETPNAASPNERPSDDESPLSEPRGECMPGCCLTMDFDIELAPIDVPVELPLAFALALPPTPQSFAPMLVREAERLRPFDRGPPRVDRSTALRVYTVLLI
ncbi:MAG: hypothetical protein ACI89X_003351 [Planctomycetota bacterium]|jgi:hypothetical protein